MTEKGLFVLWEKAMPYQDAILNDIKSHFHIDEVFEVNWGDNFSDIVLDFYKHDIPPGEDKAAKCGTGTFAVVVVTDSNPVYKIRKTLRAEKIVEANFFDAKKRYRKIVSETDPYCIAVHGTNNKEEFEHDYSFLIKYKGGGTHD